MATGDRNMWKLLSFSRWRRETGACESSCHFQDGDGRLKHAKAPVIFKMATGNGSMWKLLSFPWRRETGPCESSCFSKWRLETGPCESSCNFQDGDGRLEQVKAPVIFKMATGDWSMWKILSFSRWRQEENTCGCTCPIQDGATWMRKPCVMFLLLFRDDIC